MQLLLASGANLHCRDAAGKSAMHYAAAQDKVAAIQALAAAGADVCASELAASIWLHKLQHAVSSSC